METNVSNVKMKMQVWWLSRTVANYPYTILIVVFIFSSTCLIVPLTTKKLPNFSDPQLGFEARGTELAQRLTAWQNLMQATKIKGELIDNPIEYYYYLLQQNSVNQNQTKPTKVKNQSFKKLQKNNQKEKKKQLKAHAKLNITNNRNGDTWKELLKLKNKKVIEESDDDHKSHGHLDNDGFFCNAPSSAYSRVVLGSKFDDTNLWSMDGVFAQCKIDLLLRNNPEFTSLCQTQSSESSTKVTEQKCCRSWSPANYVALLSNRTTCLGVTESDLNRVEMLLKRCSSYYHNLKLTANCADDVVCQKHVPAECYAHNAPYHLLHYLLDQNFIQANKDGSLHQTNMTLRTVMIFLPIAASSATLNFYNNLDIEGLSDGKFHVVAMELGLKNTLFDRLLLTDSFLVLFGFIFVTICIWIYTGSFILTIATILAVIFSLGISYAFYTIILGITFFPFMNLLAIIVAVGIGADDAFIFCKIWDCHKQQRYANGDIVRLLHETMRHALPSMFVTSLTTAIAFFASIVSNVTAINCFSLFSGMTVLANFGLMITWLPASVIIADRYRTSFLSPAHYISRKVVRPLRIITDKITLSFSNFLKLVTINLRWMWLLGLGSVAIIACAVVFRYPGLQLPDSPSFQLFDSSHTFEKYDFVYAKRFWFEKLEMVEGGDLLPLRFVWGVKPTDNGNYLDPEVRGVWEADDTFDITDSMSQVWLQQFCRNLRSQPFYHETLGPLLPNCFIETLYNWMQRRCEDPFDSRIDKTPCCESSQFPYSAEVLRRCAAEASYEIYGTPTHLWNPGGLAMGGIKFSKDSLSAYVPKPGNSTNLPIIPTIRAIIVEYDSKQMYSLSFAEMDQFYQQVESWMQEQLKTAPAGMRGGWFVSRFEFYELQRTLYVGTLWAIGVSMGLALIVLIFVTLNLLVSLYAIIAISAAIVVTIAGLVLLGWKLNVLESVAVSTAIGLAVDFSLHYAVSYRACMSEDRILRVKTALEQMGGPTLMACITTGAAGAFMLPSHVLAYIQIGIFLLLVMGVSWCYATLFLCPLLSIAGPSSNFAQFQYPRLEISLFCICKNATEEEAENDRTYSANIRRYKRGGMLSESTLSTSSTMYQLHCGELEALSVRPPSPLLPPSPSSTLIHLDVRQVERINR